MWPRASARETAHLKCASTRRLILGAQDDDAMRRSVTSRGKFFQPLHDRVARTLVVADRLERRRDGDIRRRHGPVAGPQNDKRRESLRGVCWPAFQAAYEVSCRIRTGSPTSFWLDSPRTVASRRFGSPVPQRRGLGGKSPLIGGGESLCDPGAGDKRIQSRATLALPFFVGNLFSQRVTDDLRSVVKP